MGVACLKLEGRMKRPEYVAVITGIYRRLLDEKRAPTQEESRQLEAAFSRSGFTDGYYRGRTGPEMFGTRPENAPEPKELFARAKAAYEKEDRRRIPVTMSCILGAGVPAQLTASARYQVQGETLSGGQLRFALASTDRERRRAAYEAQQQTALENAEALEQLLRDLVHARNQLARENGFDNFADYGDLCMQRLGYGRAELDEFCRQVQTHIAPLYLRLQEEQRQRLGVEALLPYDRALVFPEGNAVPVAAEELPEAAHRMYHALSPEAGEFFDEMVRHDLLDVTGSPNKISGMGFCDMLGAPYRMPFIFANCDGTAGDVTVYTHELGHGLQGYLSIRSQPVADYAGLSPDLAEVHSKTMELLAQPYARDFFGNHAPQFLTEHRYDFIKELCAFCSIHTFETWLYEHPDASLAQWAEEFDRTEKSFGRAQNNGPWRQQVLSGCDLFTNVALYMFPRYVVSYALSIVCAQQLKAAYDADPADGWARYHALCASGGSKLYAETLAAAGLPLPYAPGVVEKLAQDLARQFWG